MISERSVNSFRADGVSQGERLRRTKEDAAETARRIKAAAEDLFLEKGFDNVSLEDIASAAGVTRGAVHWHFKNKQGLLLAMREKAQEPFRELARSIGTEDGATSLARLGDLVCELFKQLQSDPRKRGLLRTLIRLDLSEPDVETCKRTTFREEMCEVLQEIFSVIEKNSGLPAGWTPSSAALMLSVSIDGFVMEWVIGGEGFCISSDGQKFFRMILDNLKA